MNPVSRRVSRLGKALVAGVLMLVVNACGYAFQGSGTSLPDDIKTVHVSRIENDTVETGLSSDLEEELRSVFEGFGVLKVVEREDQPDAVLNAKVIKLDTRVKSVTGATDVALEYDLVMTIAAELRRKNGQLLWKNPQLQASESFATTSDVVVTTSSSFAQGGIGSSNLGGLENNELARGQQRVALNDLIEEISRKLYLESVAEEF